MLYLELLRENCLIWQYLNDIYYKRDYKWYTQGSQPSASLQVGEWSLKQER